MKKLYTEMNGVICLNFKHKGNCVISSFYLWYIAPCKVNLVSFNTYFLLPNDWMLCSFVWVSSSLKKTTTFFAKILSVCATPYKTLDILMFFTSALRREIVL
jgi:hypothetical protein